MRKLAIMLALSITFGLAGAAVAALPTKGKFAGKTSLHSINGFHDLVTFVSANGGRTLKKFTFGTLGCFGTGAFPVGVDPYGMPESIGSIPKVKVNANGTFLVIAKPKFAGDNGAVTTATVKGVFATARSVKGTITITQVSDGDKCGPAKMKFTAVPGTPDSLGISGP
jgi:hypothetical protein